MLKIHQHSVTNFFIIIVTVLVTNPTALIQQSPLSVHMGINVNSMLTEAETQSKPMITTDTKTRPSPRIVNGEEAIPGEFPWQIILKYEKTNLCGGVIIDENTVITAAQCQHNLPPTSFTIVAGEHDLDTVDAGNEQTRNVMAFISSENFNGTTLQNNIAILKLNLPLQFNDRVKSIPLAEQGMSEVMGECVVSGWGQNSDGSGAQKKLQKAQLDVIETKECQDLYWSLGLITEGMICGAKYGHHVNTCIGDFGGPFVCQDENFNQGQPYLAGIVAGRWFIPTPDPQNTPAADYPCENDFFPTIFTKISHHRQWIEDNRG